MQHVTALQWEANFVKDSIIIFPTHILTAQMQSKPEDILEASSSKAESPRDSPDSM